MAIKTYEKYKLKEPHKMKNLFKEVELLKSIDHPNIIKLILSIEDKRQIHLITEYVEDNLLSYLRR